MKGFLSQKGVDFTEKNVAADETAMRELTETGFLSTPVAIIDGEVVVGFDQTRLEALLSE